MKVPIHVVGGFLGAGKTSVLRSLLARLSPRERVAVVLNDFGEGALDEELEGVALSEIRGVCLCCTAPDGFVAAVARLLEEVRPDRILVEPVGLAHPADLVDTLRRAPFRDRVEIAPLVVVVDPQLLGVAPEVAAQAELADVLVANRIDLATADACAAFDAWAGTLWPPPLSVVRVVHGEIPLDALTWPEGEGPRAGPGHPHTHTHDAPDALTHGHTGRRWSWPPDLVFDRRRLHLALARLAPEVSRAKGIVRTEQGTERIDLAGGQVHARPSAWRRDSRVDLLARDPAILDRAARLLDEARRRPEEERAGGILEVAWPDGTAKVFDREAIVALADGVPDVSVLLPGRAGAAARMASVFEAAGVDTRLDAVVVASDGYVTPSVPVASLAAGLLLHEVGGQPLAAGKGGPFRLLVPDGGPCANVKSVVRIALRTPGRAEA